MSKHEKALKRERRKADRERRQAARFRHPTSPIRHGGAAALAAAAAIAAGTSAYAAPVRFDNPAGAGHFDWATPPDSFILLEVVLPASDQPPGGVGPATIIQQVNASAAKVGDMDVQTGIGFPDQYFLVGADSGELIPTTGTGWWSSVAYASPFYGYPSLLPDGVPTYLGVRFDLGSGMQYGWIGVVRDASNLSALDAFAWGYETEVGVPIEAGAVPEPGTLALLAFGAAAALRRRRQRGS